MPASSKKLFDIQATLERGFTMKRVAEMMRTRFKCIVHISTRNTAQSFGHFSQMIKCSFTN